MTVRRGQSSRLPAPFHLASCPKRSMSPFGVPCWATQATSLKRTQCSCSLAILETNIARFAGASSEKVHPAPGGFGSGLRGRFHGLQGGARPEASSLMLGRSRGVLDCRSCLKDQTPKALGPGVHMGPQIPEGIIFNSPHLLLEYKKNAMLCLLPFIISIVTSLKVPGSLMGIVNGFVPCHLLKPWVSALLCASALVVSELARVS